MSVRWVFAKPLKMTIFLNEGSDYRKILNWLVVWYEKQNMYDIWIKSTKYFWGYIASKHTHGNQFHTHSCEFRVCFFNETENIETLFCRLLRLSNVRHPLSVRLSDVTKDETLPPRSRRCPVAPFTEVYFRKRGEVLPLIVHLGQLAAAWRTQIDLWPSYGLPEGRNCLVMLSDLLHRSLPHDSHRVDV